MGLGYGLVCFFLLTIMVYTVVPDIFLHRLGLGSWKRQFSSGVVLTFDDGPDPATTPQILQVLTKYKVTAVFFLTGENAAKYPGLVRQIMAAGHQIGGHCYHHRYAWFMSPWETWREWDRCIQTLERITGTEIDLIRPPWGTFNLATFFWAKSRGKRAVLWNSEGHDWVACRGWFSIAERILDRTKEGTIVVLHDTWLGKGGLNKTVQALESICQRLVQEQKLPLVGLEFPDWPWWRRLVWRFWEDWERLFARLYKVERINSTSIFRLSRTEYQGPDLYAPDGSLLAKTGDILGEIHLENSRLRGLEQDIQEISVRILKLVRSSLPGLAKFVEENPRYRDIQVFFGLTMLQRGVRGLGFQLAETPVDRKNRGIALIQKLIMWVYKPPRSFRQDKYRNNRPGVVWISRENLLKKWLPKATTN